MDRKLRQLSDICFCRHEAAAAVDRYLIPISSDGVRLTGTLLEALSGDALAAGGWAKEAGFTPTPRFGATARGRSCWRAIEEARWNASPRETMQSSIAQRLTRIGLGAVLAIVASVGYANSAVEPAELESASNASATAALAGDPDPTANVDLLNFSNGMDAGGGFTFQCFSATIHLANLAYDKLVALWGTTGAGAPWTEYPAHHLKSLPDGTELWVASGSVNLAQFMVKYTANGQPYWDNNAGKDYHASSGWDYFYGGNVAIWPAQAFKDGSGRLHVYMVVKNIDYTKLVSARYTLDGWAHNAEANGTYTSYYPGSSYHGAQEYWDIILPTVTVNGVETVTFAGRYRLPSIGQEYWANQGGLNFTVRCTPASGCEID